MENSKVSALINLIDDPNEEIYFHVRDELVALGIAVIPALEDVWERSRFGMIFQDRIEDIIHLIQFEQVKVSLSAWARNGANDLLEGLLLVNRYQYPELEEEKVRENLENIKKAIWLELNPNLTAFEKIKVFNHILYEEYGFTGNKSNYHAPQNSYLSSVLETRKGNPLSLSVIYLLLARELEIPLFGINLPSHFILSYKDTYISDHFLEFGEERELQFYVNPFSRGTIFHRREIDEFLKQLDVEPKEHYYEPCNHIDIVKRLINNLVHSYDKLGYHDKRDELKALGEVLD